MQKTLWLLFLIAGTLFLNNNVFADCTSDFQECVQNYGNVPDGLSNCQTALQECQTPDDLPALGTQDAPPPQSTDTSNQKLAECLQNNNNDIKYCTCIINGGIKLNTSFPFLGRCINKSGVWSDGTSSLTAVSGAFTNIMMTLILTGGFAMIIRWGVQIAMGDKVGWGVKAGKQKIINVIIAFAALGSLGIILRLINPNFFK